MSKKVLSSWGVGLDLSHGLSGRKTFYTICPFFPGSNLFFCKVSSNRGIHFEKFINKCFSLGELVRCYSSVPCQAPFVFTAEYVGSFDISKNDDGIKKLHPICVTISTLTMALACVD